MREQGSTPGNEIEFGLNSLSSIFKDFPRLMKQQGYDDGGKTQPEHANLRRYWMPDEQCHVCYECNEKFTTFKRRHHCRLCGHVFCSRCSNHFVSGKLLGLEYHGNLRSCRYCCDAAVANAHQKITTPHRNSDILVSNKGNIVKSQSYPDIKMYFDHEYFQDSQVSSATLGRTKSYKNSIQSSGIRAQSFTISPDELRLNENLLQRQSTRRVLPSPTQETFDHRDLFDETPSKLIFNQQVSLFSPTSLHLVTDSTQLHAIWHEMTQESSGLEFRDHRFRLRKYSSCITGQELVDWLMKTEKTIDRTQAVGIGQALIDGKWLLSITDNLFQDKYILYQKNDSANLPKSESFDFPDGSGRVSSPLQTSVAADHDPKWVRDINYDSYADSDPSSPVEDIFFSNEHTWIDASDQSETEQSSSGRSAISYSSFVDIDANKDLCKYTRQSLASSIKEPQEILQPKLVDESANSISAEFLRSFLAWHGTYLKMSYIPPSINWREDQLHSTSVSLQEKRAYHWLRELYLQHDLKFLRQLLEMKSLETSWAEVVISLAKQAVESITPDPHVNMNICYFVKVKKMLDSPEYSRYVNGVVFTKHVVHKEMKSDIENPKIMLISFPLEYQRVRLKFQKLDPIVHQEKDFFRHLVSRITARSPDVVVVGNTAARLVQEYLLEADVTLIINVKSSVMERLSRCTETEIIYSIDKINHAQLGTCASFYVKQHNSDNANHPDRSLVYFDGCKPVYGCTILLRGSMSGRKSYLYPQNLIEVEKILRFVMQAMYSAKLEISYLLDQQDFSSCFNYSKFKRRDKQSASSLTVIDDKENFNIPSCHSQAELDNFELDSNAVFKDTFSEKSKSLTNLTLLSETREQNLVKGNQIGNSVQDIKYASARSFKCNHRKLLKLVDHDLRNECDSIKFMRMLQSCLFCTSPVINIKLPYLISEDGQSSSLQCFFNQPIFWSEKLQKKSDTKELHKSFRSRSSTIDSTSRDKLWMNPQQLQADHLKMAEEVAPQSSVDISIQNGELPMSTGQESFYTHHYKQHRRNISSEGILAMSGKLSKWEQIIMNKVFQVNSNDIFSSTFIASKTPIADMSQSACGSDQSPTNTTINSQNEPHEFISKPMKNSAHSDAVIDILAGYRSDCHIPFCETRNILTCDDLELHLAHIEMVENNIQVIQHTACYHDNIFDEEVETSTSESQLPIDCFDPSNHQHISVLFSSHSILSPNYPFSCVPPWVVDIDFYYGNDITLGRFLERYCFRQSYNCPNAMCHRPMLEHVRSFVYDGMCLNIIMKELSKTYEFTSIVTWNWNLDTKQATDIHALSHDSWSLSFAKFLELRLSGNTSDVENDEYHVDNFNSHQYFMHRDIVAAFKCFPVEVFEINFPNVTLTPCEKLTRTLVLDDEYFTGDVTLRRFSQQMKYLAETAYELLDSILDNLNYSWNNKVGSSESPAKECHAPRQSYFETKIVELQDERSSLREKIDSVQLLLQNMHISSTSHHETTDESTLTMSISDDSLLDFSQDECNIQLSDDDLVVVFENILMLKICICKLVHRWNNTLQLIHIMDKQARWVEHASLQTVDEDACEEEEGVAATEELSFKSPTLGIPGQNEAQSNTARLHGRSPPSTFKSKTVKENYEKHSRKFNKQLSTSSSVKSFFVNRILSSSILVRPIICPLPPDHHYFLPECKHNRIIVRDNECSSLIAYSLTTKQYMQAYQEKKSRTEEDVAMTADMAKESNQTSHDESNTSSKQPDHIEIQFHDQSTKFYCKVYFAELFQNFRSKTLDGGEEQYITSLCRSVKWAARGGKSGLNFHKTRDEQFILKQMSRLELQSFLEFAPNYVEYMLQQINDNEPTVLSKIFGIYRISYHNTETNKSLKQDVLIIENLFYAKNITQRFDLKGSVRNRHVKVETDAMEENFSVEGNVVLQDENLLNMMSNRPLYVHAHTKHLLHIAISRDTDFLARHLVMDYSLLVGVDGNTNQIYVGIIDYIRTFTWDKRLEMVVKSYGMLSARKQGVRSMPTVVSPDVYKSRFCEAMDKYFLILPDRWFGMQSYC